MVITNINVFCSAYLPQEGGGEVFFSDGGGPGSTCSLPALISLSEQEKKGADAKYGK
jgi:hypothetical protein